jgi:hypothetical protein
MKLLVTQYSPVCYFVISLWPKYSQHCVLETFSLRFPLNTGYQVSLPYKEIIVSDILIFRLLDGRQEDIRFWTER